MAGRVVAVWLVAAAVIACAAPSAAAVPEEADEMFWGTYKPGHYFGMLARTTTHFETGMMVSRADNPDTLRDMCDLGDDLQRYGWLTHDGREFGEHELSDRAMNLQLIASFAKFNHTSSNYGGSWTNRFSGRPLGAGLSDPVSLFYYVVLPEATEELTGTSDPLVLKTADKAGLKDVNIVGKHPDIGSFSISMVDSAPSGPNRVPRYPRETSSVVKSLPDLSVSHFVAMRVEGHQKHRVAEMVKQRLQSMHRQQQREWREHLQEKLGGQPGGITRAMIEDQHKPLLIPTLPNTVERGANVIVIQRVLGTPFEVDVAYTPHGDHMKSAKAKLPEVRRKRILSQITGAALTEKLNELRQGYVAAVEEKFGLERKHINPVVQQIVYPVLSNLVGGFGFFHGHSVIQEVREGKPRVVFNAHEHQLFTAVPSRPSFPRGFLWDEGFHQLLIQDWDVGLTIESLESWLNLMDENGWIAREQILGDEARSRVPDEFVPQSREHANPPTFFLVVEKMLRKAKVLAAVAEAGLQGEGTTHAHLDALEEVHYASADGASAQLAQYNAFFANNFEKLAKHLMWYTDTQAGVVDGLYRWRGRRENHTFTSGLDDYPRSRFPSDDELHVDLASWLAFGARVLAQLAEHLNMEGGQYESMASQVLQNIHDIHYNEKLHLFSDIAHYSSDRHAMEYVHHIGYVNMFPLALGLIPRDSPRLLYALKALESETKLWSPFGIRSLSVSDPYHGKGDNYWTGPIWVNINYLILRGLKLHYIDEGPYHETARKLYKDLREGLTVNIFTRYQETGYVWEQYDAETGAGLKSHPFTGWTALVVSILAEQY